MEVMVILVPLALCLGGVGLAAFLWSLNSGQYDDLEGAAWRAIADDDEPPGEAAGLTPSIIDLPRRAGCATDLPEKGGGENLSFSRDRRRPNSRPAMRR